MVLQPIRITETDGDFYELPLYVFVGLQAFTFLAACWGNRRCSCRPRRRAAPCSTTLRGNRASESHRPFVARARWKRAIRRVLAELLLRKVRLQLQRRASAGANIASLMEPVAHTKTTVRHATRRVAIRQRAPATRETLAKAG